ncbi:MAG TPA: hypothetical protein VG759_25480 [Candidatus Angelobacter sp.]|jgi:hypothetical protein|nr:hypothetical protein [Candidatus Angelobacter sp.]
MAFGSGKTFYKPGEAVPKSGIYRVLHKNHRDPHETSLQSEQVFPACKQCGTMVKFELLLAAETEKQD